MSPGTSAFSFAMVCEAPADLRLASGLADRVLCAEVDWIDPDGVYLHRRWRGLTETDSHLEWHEVPRLARERRLGPQAHGHFGGEPGALDAAAARKALLLLKDTPEQPDAVVLVRDTDGQEDRRRGLEQARRAAPWPFPVVLAVAHTKRECWVLAGFEPRSEAEESRLGEVRREIGFDPRVQAENLTASDPRAPKNAKRILNLLLTEGDPDREDSCWRDCDLATLTERGQATGLAEYLDELRTRLVPLVSGRRAQV